MPTGLDLQGILAGERRSIARAISLVERGGQQGRDAATSLFPYTGRAHIIGITGAPGTGKSTVVVGWRPNCGRGMTAGWESWR